MITTRMSAVALMLASAAVIASGCSSTSTEETSAAPAPAATTAVPSTVELPDPTYPAPTDCPDFMMTAAHMATDWQYLNLNLGTTNDEGPTLADLRIGSTGMQDLAAQCAPNAVDAVDAFAATVEPVIAVYTTQPTGDQVAQVDESLAEMQKAGAAMFTALDMATYAWE